MKNWKIISLFILSAYLIFCQSCLKMRISDKKNIEKFGSKGVNLKIDDFLLNEQKIHYAKTGNDTMKTIVFIHGSPGSWNAYEKYLLDTGLLNKYRLISVDRSGFGYSNFNEPQNLQTQTTILNELLKHIQNGKEIYLVGHSYGGPIVANMAAQNTRINGIMIIAGALSLAEEKPEKWRKLFINTPLKYMVPGALNPSNHELWWLKSDLVYLNKIVHKINCKVFILHGNKDQLVPYGNVNYMTENFTAAKMIKSVTIKNENHFIPWTQYELVKQQLMLLTN